ncbi:HD domain-containing protein (plasmid) [Deinococcus sp. D7000]|nr:HD domain-containing protein [Deinococcus sp. D7000]
MTLGPAPEYRRLVEEMPIMLWTADPAGHWTHVNARWTEYTGLIGEAQGFGFEAALHPDDVAPTLKVWTAAIHSGQPYDIEYRLRDTGGHYRWFVVRGRKVATPGADDVTWVGSCTDIDAQKQAETAALTVQRAAVRALGLALEVRDGETGGHTDRVVEQALALGRALDLNAADLMALELGATLHDVGKIGIPDHVLRKPAALDLDERVLIQAHPAQGARFAAALGFLPPAALDVIRHHHERWDGQGYPDELAWDQIPLLARIFAVVDVYDALISVRPYKAAWTLEQAHAEIARQAGTQFDPQVVRVFLEQLGFE